MAARIRTAATGQDFLCQTAGLRQAERAPPAAPCTLQGRRKRASASIKGSAAEPCCRRIGFLSRSVLRGFPLLTMRFSRMASTTDYQSAMEARLNGRCLNTGWRRGLQGPMLLGLGPSNEAGSSLQPRHVQERNPAQCYTDLSGNGYSLLPSFNRNTVAVQACCLPSAHWLLDAR
jgi:hypothetical protein